MTFAFAQAARNLDHAPRIALHILMQKVAWLLLLIVVDSPLHLTPMKI
jgi:hypothetical protein